MLQFLCIIYSYKLLTGKKNEDRCMVVAVNIALLKVQIGDCDKIITSLIILLSDRQGI